MSSILITSLNQQTLQRILSNKYIVTDALENAYEVLFPGSEDKINWWQNQKQFIQVCFMEAKNITMEESVIMYYNLNVIYRNLMRNMQLIMSFLFKTASLDSLQWLTLQS